MLVQPFLLGAVISCKIKLAMEKMENNFLSYEVAHKLADKGFDEECLAFYDSNGHLKFKADKSLKSGLKQQDLHELNTLAPLYQQVINWFDEKHGIHIMFTDYEGMDTQIEIACKHIRRPVSA